MCHDYSAALLVLVSQLGRFALLPIYDLVLNCSMPFLFVFYFPMREQRIYHHRILDVHVLYLESFVEMRG
jgi:hypothetical protein